MTSTPPFRRIAETLRRDIREGRLEPGEQLPSENQLAERHETTRATVRKALALLRSEGLVVSEQGRGAFVRPRPPIKLLLTGSNWRAHRGSGQSNFNAEAASQGRVAKQNLLTVDEIAAPAEIAERLGLSAGSPVIVRKRLFLVDDMPMQFCDGYYPADLFRDTAVAAARRIRGGVHGLIEDPDGPLRRRVTQFVEDLDIRMPVPSESETLMIPEGIPVVRVLRTAYDSDGEALEVLDSLIPSHLATFRYVIDVP